MKSITCRFVSYFLLAASAAAQTDPTLGSTWTSSQPQNFAAIPAEGAPGGFTTAFRATTTALVAGQPWTPQLSLTVPAATAAGQWLRFRFWARSRTGSLIGLIHELAAAPNTKALDTVVKLNDDWKEFAFTYQSLAWPSRTAALRIRLGLSVGAVEVAGIRLEDWGNATAPPPSLGFDPYGGQAVDDTWRAAAQQRIRQFRMGTLQVSVVDAEGQPIPGATVEVEQTRHAFRFGTAIADGPLFATSADGERYRAEIKRLFNYAVLENALKWDFQNGNGFPIASRMLDWCAANQFPVRGHNLLWPAYRYLPANVRNLRGQALRDAMENRVKDATSKTRGRVVLWDVVNEAVTNTEVFQDAGRDLFWKSFQWAREVDPDVGLVYNDYNISNTRAGANEAQRLSILKVIQELLDHGAPLTMLGDQGHMNNPLTPIPRVLETWDDLAQFGLPLEVTEFDVVLGGIRDEDAQGQYLADYLTAAFSHPRMESFLLWGFWDGAHWLSAQGAGLFRRDWSRRPLLDAYERLVFHEWWTREKGETSEAGTFSTPAFKGAHRIKVTVGETTRQVEVALGESAAVQVVF
ncbi:MAG: endo-1,4-beta-xylanase [Bryobacteraceae bacterium]|nr:endo-1,4-beta-xylanase [Bryobacteraceae bacterium]